MNYYYWQRQPYGSVRHITPKRFRDNSKYGPHQGKQEVSRRLARAA